MVVHSIKVPFYKYHILDFGKLRKSEFKTEPLATIAKNHIQTFYTFASSDDVIASSEVLIATFVASSKEGNEPLTSAIFNAFECFSFEIILFCKVF